MHVLLLLFWVIWKLKTFQSMQGGVIPRVVNVMGHFVHTKHFLFILNILFFIIQSSSFELLAVHLREEIE